MKYFYLKYLFVVLISLISVHSVYSDEPEKKTEIQKNTLRNERIQLINEPKIESDNTGVGNSKYYQLPLNSDIENPFNIESIHVNTGTPYDDDPSDDYIIVRSQYVVSYNQYLNVPNWVSWELNQDWIGEVERYRGSFRADTSLPDDFYLVRHGDYTNSGYDRGHIVRSKERTANESDNRKTFKMTNIIPQTPDLNRGVWLKFEYYCEELCLDYDKQLFIISGGIFATHSFINDKVAIPDTCYKIVVVLERGQDNTYIDENTTVIAVAMPNIQGIRNDNWEQYVTSVRKIERSTGYNFLNKVPKHIQDVIENKIFVVEEKEE